MKRKIQITDLQFGMYVYELDRPWTETLFMFRGLVLKTEQQIEGLRKYCKHVSVDTLQPQKLLDLARLPTAPGGEPYRVRRTLEYGMAGVSAKDLMLT